MQFKDLCKNWERLFIRAKIRANPSDYKLTNHLIFVSDLDEYNKYNIFSKTDSGEVNLAQALDLAPDKIKEYFSPNRCKYEYTKTDIRERLDNLKYTLQCFETNSIINWNNIHCIDSALNKIVESVDPKLLVENTIGEYLTLHFKLFHESSLCSNLMYLLDSSFDKYSLLELDDLTKAREYIKDKQAPLIHLIQFDDKEMDPACYLGHPIIPWKPASSVLSLSKSEYLNEEIHDAVKVGLMITTIYLCEILYYLKEMHSINLERLFLEGYEKDSFISDYFYSMDDHMSFVLNKDLEACFDIDTVRRFEKFKKYILSIFKKEDNFNDWKIPRCYIPPIAMDVVRNCYAEAVKVNRVKHIQLMYGMYRTKPDKPDLGTDDEDSFMGATGVGGSGMGEGVDNSLFNFDDLMDIPQSDSPAEGDPDTVSRRKEFGAKLESIDEITEDSLKKSMYEYDIEDIPADNGNRSSYERVATKVDMIKKSLIRAIREIKTYNSGGKMSGLSSGKLDIKNIHKYKQTKDIFCANRYKIKEMDLAFGLVLDQSGSMNGSKIEDGKITMILLHEVLLALRINHNIIGHTSYGDLHTKIFKYYYFNEEKYHNVNKPYCLAGLRAYSGNCDSGALYYEEQLLNHVRNKDKICIIFSDGEPTECTGSQLSEQVRHMEKNGIHVIGVGVDFPGVNEYYPDHANGKSLKEMVDIVVKILNRYVLEKKD